GPAGEPCARRRKSGAWKCASCIRRCPCGAAPRKWAVLLQDLRQPDLRRPVLERERDGRLARAAEESARTARRPKIRKRYAAALVGRSRRVRLVSSAAHRWLREYAAR